MPRKRKRKRLNWGPILFVLLVANVAAGFIWSRLTSVTQVQVHGAATWDESRILAALRPLHNVPAALIDPRPVESAVQALPEVDHASLSRNIFGHATVNVAYRAPIAHIGQTGSTVLAADGFVYKAHTLPKGLPVVLLPEDTDEPMVGFLGNWQSGDVANVCTQVRDLALNRTVVVQLTKDGGVCLNIGAGGQVQLGQPTELDKKLALLRRKLQENPAFLETVEYLDVKAPERPQQKLKNQERKK